MPTAPRTLKPQRTGPALAVEARLADRKRGNANQRGYTHAWRVASKAFLALFPLCAACADHGLTVAATLVDHIIPHRGDKALFWDRTNWQPLCTECHNAKTARGG